MQGTNRLPSFHNESIIVLYDNSGGPANHNRPCFFFIKVESYARVSDVSCIFQCAILFLYPDVEQIKQSQLPVMPSFSHYHATQ